MAKKTTKREIAAGITAGLVAAAAAGYYFYGSKRAKKNRKVVAHELKADWKMIQKEIERIGRTDVSRAKVVRKRVAARGKKSVKKIVEKVSR